MIKVGYIFVGAVLTGALCVAIGANVITQKRLNQFKDLYYGEMKVANDLRFKLALSEFHAQKLEQILRVEYPNLNLDFARPEDFKERIQE